MGQLEVRCRMINKLFNELMATNSRTNKEIIVLQFRKNYPKLNKDLDFCFEVLAGYHKLGYTYGSYTTIPELDKYYDHLNDTIRTFVTALKSFSSSVVEIEEAYRITPPNCRRFIENLVNRNYKLGYSNKQAMVTSLSPMLAKKYPETFREGYYYIQEKLDGNRCIAHYNFETEKWEYQSRSGKPLKVNFDMSWADKNYVYDGEVMTLDKAGTRDFNRTSGTINSKYGDKSGLHYFIYDLIIDDLTYERRWEILKTFINAKDMASQYKKGFNVSPTVSILPTLNKIWVNANLQYNGALDRLLDYIVDKGGEGIILRDPDAIYEHKRCNGLLKYKKTQTCDLRIIGWNEGKGKYEGMIGSFICATDDGTLECSVAGISDEIRMSNPDDWMGKIIEVAYFDKSKGVNNTQWSLRFPRFKKVRDDKTETSLW